MSTETAMPRTWLDAETVEELQPPCDSIEDTNAATYYVVGLCQKCGTVVHLICKDHHDRILGYLAADSRQTFRHPACGTGGLQHLRSGRL